MEFQLDFFFFLVLVVLLTVFASFLVLTGNKFQEKISQHLPLAVSFGSGMLLSTTLGVFLPHTFQEGNSYTSLISFLGVSLVIFSEKFIVPKINLLNYSHCDHDEGSPHFHHTKISPEAACSSIGCIALCAFFDGIEINVGFELGKSIGWFVGFGLLFHCVLEGIVVACMAKLGGLTNNFTKWSILIVGLFILLGGIFGNILKRLFSFEDFVLPLATGVLLYVCFVHLLSIALRRKANFFIFLLGASFFFIFDYFFHTH